MTGVSLPVPQADREVLRRQAHELLAGLLPSAAGGAYSGHTCPITGAAVPADPFDRDRLRRQAHEFIETLLITFNEATGEKGLPTEDKVPLLRCAAPVQAGGEARASLQVANDEQTPSDVSLYCTNFVADSGYEIPALRVHMYPRRQTIPSGSQATFEIRISVLQQTPAGMYSGLVQAMGNKYLKAVLSVEVL